MNGVVLYGSNNAFDVECGEPPVIRRCTLKGKKLHDSEGFYNPLAPGDFVELCADGEEGGQITALCTRRNAFVRWNVKGRSPQLIAANIDAVFIVTTPDAPPFRPRFVDRALLQAEYQNIPAWIVINKSDLHGSVETLERIADWERVGYTVLIVSAHSGSGMADVAAAIAGKTVALVGQSGVGKSTLVNALTPKSAGGVPQRTAALSEKYRRGTHTTSRGELLRMSVNGVASALIDTPGVRRFVTNGINAVDCALYFRELSHLAGTCGYGYSCTHTVEAACAILDAFESGVISESRYDSYLRIREEIASGSWED